MSLPDWQPDIVGKVFGWLFKHLLNLKLEPIDSENSHRPRNFLVVKAPANKAEPLQIDSFKHAQDNYDDITFSD